jgi:hypothetical protein
MKHVFRLSTLAIAGILAVSACGSAENDAGDAVPASRATDPLSVLEADEPGGKLVLKFEKDGRAIVFDMRLGPKMATPPEAEELAKDPELPTYEADARILDSHGSAFRMRIGGHSFIDESWEIPVLVDIDVAGRTKDFALVGAALPALRALRVPAGLEQLRLAAVDMGRSAGIKPALSAPSSPEPSTPEPSTPAQGVANPGVTGPGLAPLANLAVGPSSVTWWDFFVMKKSAFGANHSSVSLYGNAGSNAVFHVVSCNHGTCADNTNTMNQHCYSGRYNDDGTHTRYFQTSGCSTPYAWNSGPGHHNCNDDSELQVKAIKADKLISTTASSCSAAGAHYWAPGC